VPRHWYKDFEGAGLVKNKEGEISSGYKAVWIQEIIDRKGVWRRWILEFFYIRKTIFQNDILSYKTQKIIIKVGGPSLSSKGAPDFVLVFK
jgi:hypothetical protein